MKQAERKSLVTREFTRRFGTAPEIWARAPGRVDLMGSHTDYNQGYVLTLSIDRDTWLAARSRNDEQVTIYSLNLDSANQDSANQDSANKDSANQDSVNQDSGGTFSLHNLAADGLSHWTNYVRGVAKVLLDEGYALTGFDGLIHSTVPFGSGLSSSAALEVATAVVFEELGNWRLDPVQRALLCQRAENQFVGVNCGILDQYTSSMGQAGCALLLDCRNLSSRPVPIANGISIVICDTRAKRQLTGSEYDERRAQCEQGARLLGVDYLRDITIAQFAADEANLPDVVARRCRFIIEENQRVLDLALALPAGNEEAIKSLTAASYAGARDLYEIGSPEMAAMMAAMLGGPGVIGARQAGAGFGGCMVAFVQDDRLATFAGHVQQAYTALTGISPKVYPVQASPGAGYIKL